MASKRANGEGCIRQRKDGTWEAIVSTGRDTGTGKLIRKSYYGKTQAEVRKKLTASAHELDEGTYMEPSKMTVAQWLDTWLIEYTKALKAYSLRNYQSQVKNHIKPFIGAVKVADLTPDIVQRMYNRLASECNLAPKTIRNIHGILHSAFETLIDIGEVRSNPCTACAKRLPKVMKKELHTLADDDLTRFMDTIKGNPLENLFLVDLFTGLRQGELLGLRWSCVNVEKGCITIDRQLYMPEKGGQYSLQPLKNRKVRVIWPAPFVFDILKRERMKQVAARLKAGALWNTDGFSDLVFTNDLGGHLSHKTVYKRFKAAVALSGIPDVRFHDMRHSYAVASLRSGDDVKTVQENLGHATAAFTLDQYAFSTENMKRESAQRMEKYIASITQN